MTAEKSVIIIGAGIAGLAAGCYARRNGYRTHLFELHDSPGGLCTAWERKTYVFYMAGQWGEPGGMVPVVAMSGRNAARMICHHDKRAFVTATP